MRSRVLSLAATAALVYACASAAGAQQADSARDSRAFSFYDRGPYRPGIPRPDSLLGYEAGAWNTQYAAQERTLLAIAAAAPERVRVETFARTPEHRTMRLYIVSSPDNIRRLDAIRAALDTLADPRLANPATRAAIATRVPAVVWLSASVHGNEPAGFEAAMWLLYHLAASDDSATTLTLQHTIVVINPSSNPDGHERFAVWYNSFGVSNPDPAAAEHHEPWSIQGRFNHYRFDMNRDVIASTQPEVQGIIRGMLRWHPMVAMDLHGQVGSYFFPPPARPVNSLLGPDAAKWLEIIGRGNAAGFDRYGWMYFSRDVFDLYYPGYWDTWPSLTGAIGMTYETDGGGWKGLLWRRDDGSLLSFRDGIAKHYVAALSTILTTGAHAADRVHDWAAFRTRAASADATPGAMRRVVLVPGADPGRAAGLVSALLRAGIDVRQTTAPLTTTKAHPYLPDDSAGTETAGPRKFQPGVYVVDLAQPQGAVAHAILDPAPRLDSTFARTQIEKYRRNIARGKGEPREDYEFYDVTSWALPVAFGVESYWLDDAPAVAATSVALPDSDELSVTGGITNGPARSAYVFAPDADGATRLAYALLDRGVRLAVATQPIEAEGKSFPRGTWVVRVTRNDSTVHARVDSLAKAFGVTVLAVNTGYTTEAQYGIGSEPTQAVITPRVALVGGDGVSQTAYGAAWWTLEHRYGVRFLPLSVTTLGTVDLTKVNVIVVPDAASDALTSRLGKDAVDRLRAWVRAGGTLVVTGGAAAWAAREDVALTSARAVGADKDTTGVRRNDAPQPVPGSDFDVVLDRTHWITYGCDRPRITVMMTGDVFLRASKDGANVAVFPTTGPLTRAGFVWPDNTERLLRGTSFVIDEPTGRGHVILFAADPMFRGWWRSLDRLVLNAILLGPSF
jgi:Zinc carboxypeptidase